jgi:LemA protein
MVVFWILLAIMGSALVWAVLIYNRLVRLRQLVREGWSGIDVQLKRRTNLIPNLVETVKGYLTHERDLISRVTELRSRSLRAESVTDKQRVENELSRSLANIWAVAENYPDLKANQNFLDLQGQLSKIEEEIQMARRYYNGTVRELNIKIESFPSNLIAGPFGFQPRTFFEIGDAAERAVPQVEF